MSRSYLTHKGIALYIVLATLLIVIILANVVLSIILSQSRLTHHQVSRIQSYYACLAGMNYAFEQLRRGNWTAGNNYTMPFDSGDFKPLSILGNSVSITITPPGPDCVNPPGNSSCVSIAANYTYTP